MGRAVNLPETLDSQSQRRRCPETKMFMHVLQRAIIDSFAEPGRDVATVRQALDAQAWLTGGSDALAVACEAVNLDPGMVETWAKDMATQGWPRARYVVWIRIATAMSRDDKA